MVFSKRPVYRTYPMWLDQRSKNSRNGIMYSTMLHCIFNIYMPQSLNNCSKNTHGASDRYTHTYCYHLQFQSHIWIISLNYPISISEHSAISLFSSKRLTLLTTFSIASNSTQFLQALLLRRHCLHIVQTCHYPLHHSVCSLCIRLIKSFRGCNSWLSRTELVNGPQRN